ncbi:MAG TPA: hypothetical protein VJ484_07045, partial [Lysobacter sp.]|nr:hypothetical protein [Lysobacter sp.]
TLITRELRRAGYDAEAVTRLGLGAELSNFTTLEAPPSGPAGCVSYQYNRAYDKFRAVRLNKGALEMATANAVITGCTAGSWNVVSDPDVVTITSFTPNETRESFSDIIQSRVESGNTVVTAGCGVVRNISVDITGSLVGDASISRSIHDEVRVRADPLQFVSKTYAGFGPAVPTVDEECALRDLCLSAYGKTEDNDPDCAGASP